MLGVRPQLMHNANLAFAASELLFNNLPVLPLHFIFGALFGVQYTSHGRTQGGAAFGPAGSPEASLSARACLRLPQVPWPASANQLLGPRWPAIQAFFPHSVAPSARRVEVASSRIT